jgi:hypothetical protein
MPRRLPVVVSQSPLSGTAQRHLEETLVTALLMEAGVDLNVVPHVEHLDADGTGLLCLEGLAGPLVFLSWLDPDAAHQALAERGIHGRQGRTAFRQQVPGTNDRSATRTIYHIDLRQQADLEPLCAEIRRIRDDLATPTIGLVAFGGGNAVAARAPSAPESPASNAAPIPATRVTQQPNPQPTQESALAAAPSTPAAPGPPAAQASAAERPAAAEDVDDDPELERLVNQLDELDL